MCTERTGLPNNLLHSQESFIKSFVSASSNVAKTCNSPEPTKRNAIV